MILRIWNWNRVQRGFKYQNFWFWVVKSRMDFKWFGFQMGILVSFMTDHSKTELFCDFCSDFKWFWMPFCKYHLKLDLQKTFSIKMDSEFESSKFVPLLYLMLFKFQIIRPKDGIWILDRRTHDCFSDCPLCLSENDAIINYYELYEYRAVVHSSDDAVHFN